MLFEYFLLLVALGYANAATIATVNCDGLIVSDPNFATCNSTGSVALAEVDSVRPGPGRIAEVFAGASADFFPDFARAQASLSSTYVFTVTDGTGGGFFLPCLSAQAFFTLASASFGGYSEEGAGRVPNNLCQGAGFSSASTFDYGVGQQFLLQLTAFAGGFSGVQLSAEAGLGFPDGPSFEFWDAQGNPLSNVTFTLTEVPEPASFALLLAGLLALWVLRTLNSGSLRLPFDVL